MSSIIFIASFWSLFKLSDKIGISQTISLLILCLKYSSMMFDKFSLIFEKLAAFNFSLVLNIFLLLIVFSLFI
ncbi:Uncharacterised protein [Chlamydia abortus]|nr:Uncharacterised protein [Chlamydia abortus]